MIKFLCPNGHTLSAPENLAGKPGKCPKCNTAFVVPKPEEPAPPAPLEPAGEAPALAPAAATAGAAPAPAPAAEATTAPPAAGNPAPLAGNAAQPAANTAPPAAAATQMPELGSGKGLPPGEVFVFLCPNGHRLNGPPSMKGKPGQCPHCGARFRIPSDEDLEDLELPEEEDVPTGQAEDEEEIPEGRPEGGVDFNRLFGGGSSEEVVDAAVEEAIAPPPPGAGGLGYIVGRLWERRTDDTELEIFLGEGEIVTPDFFSEVLSSSDYGVFATQEGDGSFAVTVIPWNTVRRVGMRRIGQLPGSLFG